MSDGRDPLWAWGDMEPEEAAYVAHLTLDGDVSVIQARERWERFGPSTHRHWRMVLEAVDASRAKMEGDTPGVPADQVPAPRTDLRDAMLVLPSQGAPPIFQGPSEALQGKHIVAIGLSDYAAAGRVFKWLMGQVALARRKVHAKEEP